MVNKNEWERTVVNVDVIVATVLRQTYTVQ